MAITGIDQSWGKADPEAAKRAGVEVVSMYLSYSSGKNASAKWIKAYHRQGIGVILNWESQPGAPLKGARQGAVDAAEAVRQVRALIKAVGYAPKNRIAIPFSCDRDVTPNQIRGPVAAYYRNTRTITHNAGYGNAVYGEYDLIEYLARNRITDAEWQTYAWSGGRLSKFTDFYQYHNGQRLGGASVDYDRVIHADDAGVWWPPNHKLNRAGTAAPGPSSLLEIIVSLDPNSAEYKRLVADVSRGVWAQPIGKVAAGMLLTQTGAAAAHANSQVMAIGRALAAPGGGLLARVASLQATVAEIAGRAGAGGAAHPDVQAIADAVAAKIKSFVWKAS